MFRRKDYSHLPPPPQPRGSGRAAPLSPQTPQDKMELTGLPPLPPFPKDVLPQQVPGLAQKILDDVNGSMEFLRRKGAPDSEQVAVIRDYRKYIGDVKKQLSASKQRQNAQLTNSRSNTNTAISFTQALGGKNTRKAGRVVRASSNNSMTKQRTAIAESYRSANEILDRVDHALRDGLRQLGVSR